MIKLAVALLFFCPALFAAENDILICENGTEMFAWDLEFVKEAEQSIEISACFFGGEILQTLLSTIEERMQERPQLQVHIMATPILMEDEDKILVDRLLREYRERFHLVHAFNVMTMDPTVGSIDNHMKMFIVDEKYYALGGSNYDDIAISEGTMDIEEKPKYKPVPVDLPSGSRDQDLVGRGSLARELRLIFFKNYALWERFNEENTLFELNPDRFATKWFFVDADPFVESFETFHDLIALEEGQIRLVCGAPYQKHNLITQEYTKLLREAKKEVWIANLYYNPAPSIFRQIQRAHVPFTIITNGVRKRAPACNKMYCWANRVNYVPTLYGRSYHFWEKSRCQKARTNHNKIYEYDVKNVVLHKKTMVVDERFAVIGSYNLGLKSDLCDYELIAVIDSPKAAKALKKVLQRDLEHSVQITPQEAQEWYFDLGTSYLGELQKNFHGFV